MSWSDKLTVSILVEEGHHALSLSRNVGPVAERQLDLVHGEV